MVQHAQAPTVRIGTWNTQWAVPDRPRGARVRAALADTDCDILCVTEGSAGLLPSEGCIIDAGTDWGYRVRPQNRRKVLLWSRAPWSEEDREDSSDLPKGRFVKGVTTTPIGRITVVGVCIPWAGAHVKSGQRDRKRWEDHEAWLREFERLPYRTSGVRTVVLGDFNQRIPRCTTPEHMYRALRSAFDGLTIATTGELPGDPGLAIDHIGHTGDLTRSTDMGIWPKRIGDEHLSDHFGVWTDFSLTPTL